MEIREFTDVFQQIKCISFFEVRWCFFQRTFLRFIFFLDGDEGLDLTLAALFAAKIILNML